MSARTIVCILLLQCLIPGCVPTSPSLNSFTATIVYTEHPPGKVIKLDSPPGVNTGRPRAFLLIHGIYGSEETFGNLPELLGQEWPGSPVYSMEYWSSMFLPNLQRLTDLGSHFKKKLEEIAEKNPSKELVIIAHSQGGLIAREGILQLLTDGQHQLVSKTRLILIGSPGKESLYATYNNLIVNSVFAPVTYASYIFPGVLVNPFNEGRALVYNRQAYDMADTIVAGPTPFMENLILRWGEASSFPEELKVYAILGVKNLLTLFDMSDGIVHSHSALFAGIPRNRIHYVPYRHFGEEAYITSERHLTFEAIRKIVEDNKPPEPQELSPYANLPVTFVLFVSESARDGNSHGCRKLAEDFNAKNGRDSETASKEADLDPPVVTRVLLDPESFQIESTESSLRDNHQKASQAEGLQTETSLRDSYNKGTQVVRGNLLFSIGAGVIAVVSTPFLLLQSFVAVPVEFECYAFDSELRKYAPRWVRLGGPQTIYSGRYAGRATVKLTTDRGRFFDSSKTLAADFQVTDDPNAPRDLCTIVSQDFSLDSTTIAMNKLPLKVIRNAVNFVKVGMEYSAAGRQKLVMTTVGCSRP